MYTNTVLIVDDSEIIMKTLSMMVRKAGYNILSAIDGKKALEFFDGRDIDLVVTDLNMPVMDGLELINKIRVEPGYCYIPIVLFFSDSREKENKVINTSGATILFDKNNIREKIISTINKMLL